MSGLPRSPLGGVKADAVADLLKRAAWDYREVLARNKQLEQAMEELTRRSEELETQVAQLESSAAERKDPDELTRTLLASAHRTAREQRESARRDGELLLKKSRARAREIEEDARKAVAAARHELARVEALRDELARELHSALEAIAALGEHGSTGDAVGPPVEGPHAAQPVGGDGAPA